MASVKAFGSLSAREQRSKNPRSTSTRKQSETANGSRALRLSEAQCAEARKNASKCSIVPRRRLSEEGKGKGKRAIIIPIAQQERMFLLHLEGKSNRAIAKQEKRHPRTVAKVIAVHAEQEKETVLQVRALFMGLQTKALAALASNLDQGDSESAWRLLEACGVVPGEKGAPGVLGVTVVQHEILVSEPSEEARQILYSRLSPKDRLKFDLLTMMQARLEAYGEDPDDIMGPHKSVHVSQAGATEGQSKS